jgi:proline iminopeptidase
VVALDLTTTAKLGIPLILFEGRHDRTVNSEVAATWFDTVKAPDKHMIWFEHSGHMPMTGRWPRSRAIVRLDAQRGPDDRT